MNPLLSGEDLPRYDEIKPGHVGEAVARLVEDAEKVLAAIEADVRPPTWANVIEELNTIEDMFVRIWTAVAHLTVVRNEPALRDAYQAAQPKVVAIGLKMAQSEALYDKLLAIKEGPEWGKLEAAQKRAIDQRLLSSKLSGIDLEGADKERFNKVEEELSQLSTKFTNNVMDATNAFRLELKDKAQVDGLSASAREMLAHLWAKQNAGNRPDPENGPWLLTLDMPVYMAVRDFCRDRAIREKMYKAYVTRAASGEKDNTPLMERILALRAEKAALLGYKNYAEVSLATKMAGDVKQVNALFEELLAASAAPAKEELKEITALANASGHKGALEQWDLYFWAKRLEEQRFGFTEEELKPYFSLPKVLDGMFALVHRLFGVTIKAADGSARVWNQETRFFKVFDRSGGHIASFFLDAYSRPENKRGGAWMNVVAVKRVAPGYNRLPVATLTCNFTPPVGDKPSLMTFKEVTTMFHEFGHGLQHMLTAVGYPDVAGVRGVEWDAVELPSQFMENWCYHKATLLGMAKHYQTGETLPEATFEKIKASRSFLAGIQMLRQLNFGMTDMALHTTENPDIRAIEKKVAARTTVIPPIPEDRFLNSFTHLFAGGYAAGYYSYKWAEVLSADAFEAFEEAGLEDPEALARTGSRFRDTVLGLGGSVHPAEVFRLFRGRAPSPKALLRHSGLLKA